MMVIEKAVTLCDKPTENYHLNLQLRSASQSLIEFPVHCLAHNLTVLVHLLLLALFFSQTLLRSTKQQADAEQD